MKNQSRRPGPESTLDEVREQLIDTATVLLQDSGVELGLSHVRLSDVIAATGHSRATAYRSLADEDNPPQTVLHHAVMLRILLRDTRADNRDVVMNAVGAELERLEAHINSDDVRERTFAMRSVIRVGGAASYYAVTESSNRAVLVAAYGALASSQVDDWRHEELRQGEHNIAELFGQLYTDLSALFGHRLKPEFDITHFATAGAAFVEGLAVRKKFSDALENLNRPTGLAGESEDWTLYAVGFEAMYRLFFEPIDKDEPFADLNIY